LIHDLGALVAKMPDRVTPPFGYELTRYNHYAGILRYERGHEPLSLAEVKAAVDAARQVMTWAKKVASSPAK
jgi:hypothetical protein